LELRNDTKDHNIPKSAWRLGGRPFIDYKWTDKNSTLRVGAQFPLYLDLSALAGYNSKNYKGLLRLNPTIAAERASDKWGVLALITLDVLADRYMLRRALDD
jgi:hypothetical protein